MKTALITGITGQDGSYLAELLISKGYQVFGMIRRSSTENYERIEHIRDQLVLRQSDLLDQLSIVRIIEEAEPDEIYNLAAQSYVPTSWTNPLLTGEFTALGVTRVLEAIGHLNKNIRFYQASSSEMFGNITESPQNEKTRFYPRSPYGVSKVYGHFITLNYRESYGIYACSGILFNHESPRRGLEFVTRKISNGVAKIFLGLTDKLHLGNLKAKRDWGFAGDYVKAMWMMLQQESPDDYVIGTGISHSVEDFVNMAFSCAGLDWKDYVLVDSNLFRPAEIDHLVADPSKAKKQLGWEPTIDFKALVKMMVDSDIQLLRDKGK